MYQAFGKLLLTGEYFVLDGALALAVPTRFGQTLKVEEGEAKEMVVWESYDAQGKQWFSGQFSRADGSYLSGDNVEVGNKLELIFQTILREKKDFFINRDIGKILTYLDFPRAWGLGTSSTLIANLGSLSGVNPFDLLKASFGGSGYDIACAHAKGPILYQIFEDTPHFVHFPFRPLFAEQLYFVFLGKKQNSREGIARYRTIVKDQPELVNFASELTAQFLQSKDLAQLEYTISKHEKLVSTSLQLPRAKEIHFPDYWGEIKSLGAWGGDFVLATSNRDEATTKAYFLQKGYPIFFSYSAMLK